MFFKNISTVNLCVCVYDAEMLTLLRASFKFFVVSLVLAQLKSLLKIYETPV